MKPNIIFSCDWESRGLYQPHHLVNGMDCFEEVSSKIIDIGKQITGGIMVWYCKIDFYADITYYNNFRTLAGRILAHGGQLGVHIHHISKEKEQRDSVFKWASERMKLVGFPVTAYSAGNGEVYDSDAEGLLQAGFRTQRGAAPYLKHEYCDWLDADLWPGYVDKNDYKRVLDKGEFFSYAYGGAEENFDGNSMLHIRRGISLEELKSVFARHTDYLASKNKFSCIGCYFHPYNLVYEDARNIIDPDVIEKWALFSRWLCDNGVEFLTDSQAEKMYAESGAK